MASQRVCDECQQPGEISTVTVTAERMTITKGVGVDLGKNERRNFRGDLCSSCLTIIEGMLDSSDPGLGEAALLRAAS